MVATTQLRLALEAEDERSAKKMEWIGFGFDLDLIWIEIGVFKNFKECARSPCNGTIFLVIIGRAQRAPHWGDQSRFCVIYVIVIPWFVVRDYCS